MELNLKQLQPTNCTVLTPLWRNCGEMTGLISGPLRVKTAMADDAFPPSPPSPQGFPPTRSVMALDDAGE